jgi:hypothetical protein
MSFEDRAAGQGAVATRRSPAARFSQTEGRLRLFKFLARVRKVRASNVAEFLAGLSAVASPAGRGCYEFKKPGGGSHGFVQFIISSHRMIQIHRLWTLEPGNGNGSIMIRALCQLADWHGVEMKLKVIPIGRKPFPMSRQQLKAWYQGHGFEGARWIMFRKPGRQNPVAKPLDEPAGANRRINEACSGS